MNIDNRDALAYYYAAYSNKFFTPQKTTDKMTHQKKPLIQKISKTSAISKFANSIKRG